MTSTESAARPPLLHQWRAAITGTQLFQTVRDRIERGMRVEIPGLPGSLKAALLATVVGDLPDSMILAILPDPDEAEEAAMDFVALLGDDAVRLLPPWPFAAYEELSPPPVLSFERHDALLHLCGHGAAAVSGEQRGTVRVVVASAKALTFWSADPSELRARELTVVESREKKFDDLIENISFLGYERTDMVEGPAEFAVRGGLVDISPPDREHGIRVEFWGERIESIREFGLVDQRAIGGLGKVRIPPVCEVPFHESARSRAAERAAVELGNGVVTDTPLERALERGQLWDGLCWYLPMFVDRPTGIADMLTAGSVVVVWEPERAGGIVRDLHRQAAEAHSLLESPGGWLPPDKILSPVDTVDGVLESFRGIDLPLVTSSRDRTVTVDADRAPAVTGDFDSLRAEIGRLRRDGMVPTILVEDHQQQNRLEDLLGSEDEGGPRLLLGQLAEGFTWPEAGLAVWPDHELFRRPRRSRRVRVRSGGVLRSYRSLNTGDLVVHVEHGIGRYEGLRNLEVDGIVTELLEMEYVGGDRLLVPIDQMSRVQRYVGAGKDTAPPLNTLGGTAWQRTVERTRTDLLEMAESLARLYAVRATTEGTAYPADDLLMEELEASFSYTETADQARAVQQMRGCGIRENGSGHTGGTQGDRGGWTGGGSGSDYGSGAAAPGDIQGAPGGLPRTHRAVE